MKKIFAGLMTVFMLAVAACGSSNAAQSAPPAPAEGGKTEPAATAANGGKALVVYFSRSGNTEALAKMIAAETGADMFRVTTVKPYPEGYQETVDLAKAEQQAKARPAINGKVENMAAYDVIYVGMPNWWSSMPMPMFTFLEQYDFAGKTIVPFVTHGGGGVANCVSDLKKTVPNAKVLEPLVISGGSASGAQGEVSGWLNRLGLKK